MLGGAEAEVLAVVAGHLTTSFSTLRRAESTCGIQTSSKHARAVMNHTRYAVAPPG